MRHLQKGQRPDGSWGFLPTYLVPTSARGPSLKPQAAATGAGVASMFTCIDAVYRSRSAGCKDKELDPSITRGLGVLAQELQAGGPRKAGRFGRFLFNLMCAMQYDGRKTPGRVDWSSYGTEQLAKRQSGNGSWSDSIHETAFALAFLAYSRPQILINKLAFRGDWNNRPMEVLSVVQWINRNCQKRANWQVVDFQSSSACWHAAPILYISGAKKPVFSDREIDRLRLFVKKGGTIISVTECKGPLFRNGIREIYRRAFPRMQLVKLDPKDSIYSRPNKVKAKHPLFMISNGKRAIVIHTDTDIAKFWQMGIKPGVNDSFQLGENIIRSVVEIR
jgi:hypothetical protein